MVAVHVLDTGRVQIHRRQVDPHRRDGMRLLATLLDRQWTDWLSVWSFAIEHPEGLVVVDAGQDPDFKKPLWDVYLQRAVRFDVTEADRQPTRLREAGLDPAAVRYHVFTHLHVDHVGAGPLPGANVVLNADEWRAATAPGGRLRGYMRPGIREPQTIEGDHDLYGDGSVRLLATPGHTAGHQSVLVTPGEGPRVLITGDAVYSEAALLSRTIDGVAVSAERSRASIDRLRELCAEAPTVVAPTHDSAAARRVADGRTTSV
ncbi:MAG TPA: N-acyl homoserine lactonase family protein [Solirubrobacterales bacterium]|nr:N-acyl homoserine lactonase family protein [Solirubrobacterales bacterium]